MASRSGFKITSDTLSPRLRSFVPRLEAAIASTVDFYAMRIEGTARNKAPWKDQTGNARSKLHAYSEHRPPVHMIVLAHGVPYGIWLEVRNEGKYAIILPTINSEGPKLMALLRTVMRKMV